jgi:hypothetical protein
MFPFPILFNNTLSTTDIHTIRILKEVTTQSGSKRKFWGIKLEKNPSKNKISPEMLIFAMTGCAVPKM